MVNGQINVLNKNLIIRISMKAMEILSDNKGKYFSSSEVFYSLSESLQGEIRSISLEYPTGALSSPASFVGSVLGCAANEGVLKRSKKICPILKKQLDCFGI